jgi:putative heme-binding domain-containing protein
MKLVPDGVTFKAVQVDGNKNFCTSDDLWFRPVNFVNAPDGCLHVCDMYREVIEHPWSIPDDIHTAVDLLRGRDKGRIWRLAAKRGAAVPAASSQARGLHHTPKLSAASTNDLVALLDHPNAWHRETAQRLLFERQNEAAVEPLRELVKSGKTTQGKQSALWSLSILTKLTSKEFIELLSDINSPLVATAARVLEPADISSHSVGSSIKDPEAENDSWLNGSIRNAAVGHLSPSTRFQVTLSLGWTATFTEEWKPPPEDAHDRWMTKVILLSSPEVVWNALKSGGMRPDSDVFSELVKTAPSMLFEWLPASEYPYLDLIELLKTYEPTHPSSSHSGLIGLFRYLQGKKLDLKTQLGKEEGPRARQNAALDWIASVMNRAVKEVANSTLDSKVRLRAIQFISLNPFEDVIPIITSLLAPSQPQELQLAALEALGSYREPAVADMLIDAWPKLTPALRDKANTILLSRTDRIAKLLDAIEAKKITPAQLSVAAKATLGQQKTPALAERIAKLLGDGSSSNRKEVIAKYASVMTMTGDATRGAKIYETACMVCHKFADKGNDVGPHLGTIKAWTAEQLVTNILDPNREVSPNFSLYLVETNDGRTLSGLITSETAGNLTLKRADGGTDTVLRSEIKSLTSPGISLMPEGLEAAISAEQMADLIAYLKAS